MTDNPLNWDLGTSIFGLTNAEIAADQERETVLTLDKLRAVQRALKPAVRVRASPLLPVFRKCKPVATPSTDDMRQMLEDIGPQKEPFAVVFDTPDGPTLVTNPANLKDLSKWPTKLTATKPLTHGYGGLWPEG